MASHVHSHKSAVVRVAVAVLLLSAAALKTYELAAESVAETGLLSSRWFLAAVTELEIFLGIWMLFGVFSRLSWAVSLACFAVFGFVSLYEAFSGIASCGCFGNVPVSPWGSLALDLVTLSLLVIYRPPGALRFLKHLFSFALPVEPETATAADGSVSPGGVNCRSLLPWGRISAAVAIFFALGISVALAIAGSEPVESDAGLTQGRIVALQPEKWVGRRFPLFDHLDVRDQLASGDWELLFYHHDCPKCQRIIAQYQSKTRLPMVDDGGRSYHFALLELPPYGQSTLADSVILTDSLIFLRGRLADDREWLVETPVEIAMTDGVVTRVIPGQDDEMR